ncbi:potassium transporter [Salinisphaera sp. USBA-960]|uniref:TrkH family potassium uptake protein n=1 Tax=Salinisphaera orenii TaxID=856731 RepID=UPI000DBE814B|nr:potassium transporter [Salifodinibacter halophilus]NNC25489.1 potassium transporter [Salifodinibacter halophilus]
MRLQFDYAFAGVQRVIGILLMIFSTAMLGPAIVGAIYGDGQIPAFVASFAITVVAGCIIWWPTRNARRELKIRDGFLVVVFFWFVLSLFGALPFILVTTPQISITNAVFESVSGLTTTGATVLTELDYMPHAILFWRVLLHWMGGMGVIVLAIAVLPMLGVGGMQLYRADTLGPVKTSKLTPRIRETAKMLWYLYVSLTAASALLFWLAGLSPFDAISDAFSAIATGGFANHDQSIGYHDSALVELISIVAMLLGATSFSMHFAIWRSANPLDYWRDFETRMLWIMAAGATALATVVLLAHGTYTDPGTAIIRALFQVVSIGTTTGFTTTDYSVWPSFLPMFLILGSFVGGCAGSTTGGMKVVRVVLLAKQGLREIRRLVHPSAMFPVKMGEQVVANRVVHAVWGFFSVYITVYVVLFLILLGFNLDPVTAFSAVAATLNNLGPGLGDISSTMTSLPALAKWVLCVAMLLGRLQIFTLLVIFTPTFWRH